MNNQQGQNNDNKPQNPFGATPGNTTGMFQNMGQNPSQGGGSFANNPFTSGIKTTQGQSQSNPNQQVGNTSGTQGVFGTGNMFNKNLQGTIPTQNTTPINTFLPTNQNPNSGPTQSNTFIPPTNSGTTATPLNLFGPSSNNQSNTTQPGVSNPFTSQSTAMNTGNTFGLTTTGSSTGTGMLSGINANTKNLFPAQPNNAENKKEGESEGQVGINLQQPLLTKNHTFGETNDGNKSNNPLFPNQGAFNQPKPQETSANQPKPEFKLFGNPETNDKATPVQPATQAESKPPGPTSMFGTNFGITATTNSTDLAPKKLTTVDPFGKQDNQPSKPQFNFPSTDKSQDQKPPAEENKPAFFQGNTANSQAGVQNMFKSQTPTEEKKPEADGKNLFGFPGTGNTSMFKPQTPTNEKKPEVEVKNVFGMQGGLNPTSTTAPFGQKPTGGNMFEAKKPEEAQPKTEGTNPLNPQSSNPTVVDPTSQLEKNSEQSKLISQKRSPRQQKH